MAKISVALDQQDAEKILELGQEFIDSIVNDRAWKFGRLVFFDKDELERTESIRDLISEYIQDTSQNRPLCVAVFGPPGSGKSFAVKEIKAALQDNYEKTHTLPYSEINLTQIRSNTELQSEMRTVYISALEEGASARQTAVNDAAKTVVPFVFFDEFDSSCAGVPLGWLNWFLAPMQDGVIGHGLEKFSLGRAIYFFAGGTAMTMAEFSSKRGEAFKAAKGPDFVSRLRGYLDISGPNADKNTKCRRALVMHHLVKDKAGGKVTLDPSVRDSFFNEGRFKHGARSISSLLEMAISKAGRERQSENGALKITLEDLPPQHILAIHADQGPLSSETIGGLIGLSLGSKLQEDDQSPASQMVRELLARVWSYGATVGFGGQWKEFTKSIAEIGRIGEPRTLPVSRIEFFSREDDPPIESGEGVTIVPVRTFWEAESTLLPAGCEGWIAAYRMRWMMSCRSVARILVEGKLSDYSGRMPGVFEETVMALALKQPVYVVGSFGGAAKVCGELLGLSTSSSIKNPEEIKYLKSEERFKNSLGVMTPLFSPVATEDFPIFASDAIPYIADHAFGGPLWTSNGLSLEENRKLFASDDHGQIIDLILKGLLRRFT